MMNALALIALCLATAHASDACARADDGHCLLQQTSAVVKKHRKDQASVNALSNHSEQAGVSLPVECQNFFFGKCNFEHSPQATKAEVTDAFEECCENGKYHTTTCTGLATDVFSKHPEVTPLLCEELLKLHEAHEARLQANLETPGLLETKLDATLEKKGSDDDDGAGVPLLDTLGEDDCEAHTQDEYCFGLQGPQCTRAPWDTCPSGQQAVSVGSIVHDTCCNSCVDGLACSEEAVQFYDLWNHDDDLPCAFEWRKAHWNSFDGRYWCVALDESSKADVSQTDGAREYDTTNWWGTKNDRRTIHSTKATKDLCAPKGTHMDCVGCSDCDGNCGDGIGDSEFCCSGKFQKVQESWGKRWGECS